MSREAAAKAAFFVYSWPFLKEIRQKSKGLDAPEILLWEKSGHRCKSLLKYRRVTK